MPRCVNHPFTEPTIRWTISLSSSSLDPNLVRMWVIELYYLKKKRFKLYHKHIFELYFYLFIYLFILSHIHPSQKSYNIIINNFFQIMGNWVSKFLILSLIWTATPFYSQPKLRQETHFRCFSESADFVQNQIKKTSSETCLFLYGMILSTLVQLYLNHYPSFFILYLL